ncbi:hypothetical protein E1262_13375 [Jiangella aurantiaca]|uniref:Uncharacterized protein n=1 Tax=Jiangella aurantiaca TaxID=2530373 RepID=A0A4R5ADG3_9ACTN|nr:hypothetical protein [Jiangella aurantiaca]TDD69306.1 hypothetical protein E1262_13375 [Jiangella aurantiaca]
MVRTWTDPAVRRLAGDPDADPMDSPRAGALLDFPAGTHPYAKWYGTHWRLVELADPRAAADAARAAPTRTDR